MSEVLSFLRAIADDPGDEARRLVFADWLEEHGDWRAEFIRLDCSLRGTEAYQPEYTEQRTRWQELRSQLSANARRAAEQYGSPAQFTEYLDWLSSDRS